MMERSPVAQPHIEVPTEVELAAAIEQINNNQSPGVYQSNPNTVDMQPEKLSSEEVAARIGSVIVSKTVDRAVGMAALPEQYAAQQLNHFNFTAAEYARAQEEQVRRAMSQYSPPAQRQKKRKKSRRPTGAFSPKKSPHTKRKTSVTLGRDPDNHSRLARFATRRAL